MSSTQEQSNGLKRKLAEADEANTSAKTAKQEVIQEAPRVVYANRRKSLTEKEKEFYKRYYAHTFLKHDPLVGKIR
jgi:hypothetical protein